MQKNINRLLIALSIIFVIVSVFNNYMVYEALSITGKPIGIVGLTILPLECNMAVRQGWNYLSLCAEPYNNSIPSLLSSVNYRYVMVWNESSQDFIIYSPRAASPPFNAWDANKSHFVYYYDASPTTFGVLGEVYDDLNLSLVHGWNPPTYPYLLTTNILRYLDSLGSNYRYMMKWNYTPQDFIIYSPRAATPQFTTIDTTEGQFIYIYNVSGAILKYNKSALGT